MGLNGNSMDDFQAELIGDFLLESLEGLESFDRDLLALEKGESGLELLNAVFRVVHTIKGTAGCLGFTRIESIAHSGENVLSLMRDGKLQASPQIADALLRLSDAMRAMLDVIRASGTDDGVEDCSELKSLLDSIKLGKAGGSARVAEPSPKLSEPPANLAADEGWGVFEDEEPALAHEELAEASGAAKHAQVDTFDEGTAWGVWEDVVEAVEPVAPTLAPTPAPTPTPRKQASAAPKAEARSVGSVRVDVELLDKLMNMVGELVLSRNQLLQLGQKREIAQAELLSLAQQFNQVTTELQQGIMKTRMQQIGTVWGKFPRIVRDLAQDLGKQVELETFGAETELDRTIVEAIKDPLTHIIRNAVDHGIETPDRRKAAGKAEYARLLMRAYHEGGQVNIEIVDDGAGISGNKICGKALEKGLITVEEAARLSEREKINMIFLPGFSTAEKLSNVSGRGVGMDVVRTNIEKIGGSVDIQTEVGRGTTLSIRIPLTLAIVGALIIRCGSQKFAIPQANISELVRIEIDKLEKEIDYVYDQPVYNLRGKLLPLVFLDRFLGLDGPHREEMRSVSIVVLRANGQDYGLLVDVVSDTEEIVVKPLDDNLSDMSIYAGATIMGDGSVALILDAVGVASESGVLEGVQKAAFEQHADMDAPVDSGYKQSLILFSLPGWDHLAAPLDSAERLEVLDPERIKKSGGVERVLYRGTVMRLLRLTDLLGLESSGRQVASEQVIVYRHGDRYLGLVVGKNRDVVESSVRLELVEGRPYIKSSAVIGGQITDLVDVESILDFSGIKGREYCDYCN